VYQHPSMREGWREGGRASRRRKRELTKTLPRVDGWRASEGPRQQGRLEWAGIPPRIRALASCGAEARAACVCVCAHGCVLVSVPEAGVCSRSWRVLFCRRYAATRPRPIRHEDGVRTPHATPSRPPLLEGYPTASLSTRSVKTRSSPAALTGKTDWSGPPSHVVGSGHGMHQIAGNLLGFPTVHHTCQYLNVYHVISS
jgi:hypothetical protein